MMFRRSRILVSAAALAGSLVTLSVAVAQAPARPAVPKAPLTAAKVRLYKERLRAYDAARIKLNLAT